MLRNVFKCGVIYAEIVDVDRNNNLPCCNACEPRCMATNDEEHAVSSVIAGPNRLYTYDTLALMMLVCMPVTDLVLKLSVSAVI